MNIVRIILTCVFLVTTCNGLCEDIDTVACQVMAANNPNLCNDPALSLTACPRFCKKCLLGHTVVCYHCDSIVRNHSDCSVTRTCNSGEQCMLHQLVSSRDGHHEYKMNCASLDMCDGHGVMMFGRRDMIARNVITQCCSDDLCNSPVYKQAVPTTSTTSTVAATSKAAVTVTPTTAAVTTITPVTATMSVSPSIGVTTATGLTTATQGCNRDIEILIQDSRRVDRLTVIQFLRDLVSHIQIGPMHNQIGVASFDRDVRKQISLDSYLQKDALLSAINGLRFRHDENDVDKGDILEFLQHHLSGGHDGERPSFKNVVIIIDDNAFGRRRFLQSSVNQGSQLSSLSNDVIVINIGRAAGHSILSSLATNANHQIDITDYSMLSISLPRVLSLLCA